MSIDNLFNIVVDVSRATLTSDDYGAQAKAWATVFEGLPGRLQRKKAIEQVSFDRQTVWSDFNFYTEPDAPIQNADRIVYDSRTFEIKGFDNANQANVFMKVDLLEIK